MSEAENQKPLRILFINRMASLVRGGGETFDLEMARHLADLDCKITLLTGLPLFGRARLGPSAWWPSLPSGDHVPVAQAQVRTPYFGWFPWDKTPGGWRLRIADFKCFEWRAARWAFQRRDQFDVIQVCELPFFVGYWKALERRARVSPRPVCMRLTAPDFYDPQGALSRADAVIASGATMKKVQAGLRVDCHNIPNGVDVTMFRPHATGVRARYGWAADDLVIVFVARFQSVKNHDLLVEAFRSVVERVPQARLVFAGSGPLETQVRTRCVAAGVAERVHFLGEVAFRDVADLYAAADLKVISSDYESFSFVALEAMASGLPLVVTRTDWVPGLIGWSPDAKSNPSSDPDLQEVPGGLVVPVGQVRPMAEALLRLLAQPQVRQRMGAWNRARVERDFGWTASARKLREVYHALAKPAHS
jgi:glycosyltransferase involved in cell wall biosynthesis